MKAIFQGDPGPQPGRVLGLGSPSLSGTYLGNLSSPSPPFQAVVHESCLPEGNTPTGGHHENLIKHELLPATRHFSSFFAERPSRQGYPT